MNMNQGKNTEDTPANITEYLQKTLQHDFVIHSSSKVALSLTPGSDNESINRSIISVSTVTDIIILD